MPVADLFHTLRRTGNRATHDNHATHSHALSALKVGRELGMGFHRTFGTDAAFKAGPFIPAPHPASATKHLTDELLAPEDSARSGTLSRGEARAAAESLQAAKLSAEEVARREREERTVWEQLAGEAEAALATQLEKMQAAAEQAPVYATAEIPAKAEADAQHLSIMGRRNPHPDRRTAARQSLASCHRGDSIQHRRPASGRQERDCRLAHQTERFEMLSHGS